MQDKNKYNTPKYRMIVRFSNRDICCQVSVVMDVVFPTEAEITDLDKSIRSISEPFYTDSNRVCLNSEHETTINNFISQTKKFN